MDRCGQGKMGLNICFNIFQASVDSFMPKEKMYTSTIEFQCTSWNVEQAGASVQLTVYTFSFNLPSNIYICISYYTIFKAILTYIHTRTTKSFSKFKEQHLKLTPLPFFSFPGTTLFMQMYSSSAPVYRDSRR